jgi:hypothetical protein
MAAKAAEGEGKGKVAVTLKRTYNYRGRYYGPGQAEIPASLARTLRLTGEEPKGKAGARAARRGKGGNYVGEPRGRDKSAPESEESKRQTAERAQAGKQAGKSGAGSSGPDQSPSKGEGKGEGK